MKKFEERLTKLEELSRLIQSREANLDDSLRYFDEGVKLARSLEKELEKIEKRVEILMNEPTIGSGEEPQLSLFPGGDD